MLYGHSKELLAFGAMKKEILDTTPEIGTTPTIDTTAEEYLALSQEEKVKLLKGEDGEIRMLKHEESRKLSPDERTELSNNMRRADGAFYDNGGIFGKSPHMALGIFNGIQAVMNADPEKGGEGNK